MRKFFQKLRRDCRGAVTVFVTLLLIPAVLVSGTGVDLARLYTARSIVHDANQLAANSALASYDALLQDLYGLYGIMKDDPEFATMVDEYIQVAVFGEDWTDRGQGTFQLFYGSDLIPGEITPAEGKITLVVSDTGSGIPAEDQQRIFERFYRVDKGRSKARGGTGLGLAIVKHAAMFHDATISVDSTLGEGTTITVRFPKEAMQIEDLM